MATAFVIPALLAATYVVVWTVGQATAATNVPRTKVGSTTPGDLGFDFRDVEFDTTDGVTLSAWYIPSRNGAAAVLLHGAGSTRSNVLEQAAVLAKHGYGIVMVDARGHGRSGGRAMDFGWHGDDDVTAAVSYLTDQPEVDPARIAAVGLSMGGEEAIGAAASDPRIKAVVAEGATNRTTADKAWLSNEFGWRGTMQRGIEWLVYNLSDVLTDASQPISLHEAARVAAPRPMLLIAGGRVADEPKAGRYIQSASPESVELWIVPDTGHTAALETHPDEWEQRVISFLAMCAERRQHWAIMTRVRTLVFGDDSSPAADVSWLFVNAHACGFLLSMTDASTFEHAVWNAREHLEATDVTANVDALRGKPTAMISRYLDEVPSDLVEALGLDSF